MKLTRSQIAAYKAKGLLPQDAPEAGSNKFGALRTKGFPSKLEAEVWDALNLMKLDINEPLDNLRRYETVRITKAQIPFNIDFACEKNGITQYHEAKGMETERFKLLKKLWPHYGPGILYIWKKVDSRGVYVAEEICPQ